MSDPCYASPSSLRSSSVSMSACIGGLPLYLPFLWIALFCIILRHLRVQLAEKTQSTEPKEDRFLPANVPVHPRATVSWQPPPTDAGMFAVTVFSTQRYTGSIGRQWHPHQISRHCIFDDTPCMQLTLWHTHQHTHTHTHTHTQSQKSTLHPAHHPPRLPHTVNTDQLTLTHKETTKNKTRTWRDGNKQCRTGIKTQHHMWGDRSCEDVQDWLKERITAKNPICLSHAPNLVYLTSRQPCSVEMNGCKQMC